VLFRSVDKDLALSFGLKTPRGALVAQMEPNGPAEKSGLKVGDIILSFNKRDINMSSDLPYVVGPTRAGSKVPVIVMRKGKQVTLTVTVGSRNGGNDVAAAPSSTGSEVGDTRLGLLIEDMTAEMKSAAGIAGVVISQVFANSPAATAGLEPGDIIVQLGFDDVDSVTQFRKIEKSLPANKPQPIRVIRRGAPLFRSIIIEE
jgi:serine protease Do